MEKNGKKPTHKKSYMCKPCGFWCENKKDYNRHLKTKKHATLSVGEEDMTGNDGVTTSTYPHMKSCTVCGKYYKSASGLWKHEQKCIALNEANNVEKTDEKESIDYKQLVLDMVSQNSELQKLLVEQHEQYNKSIQEMMPKIQNVTNNTTNNTSNKVNINIFLNEQCKDAINMTEFVHSIEVGFKELENTYRFGHVNGISQMFIDGLKDMDMYKRPLHCSNLQKRTLYVKDDDTWQRDDNKLRDAIVYLNDKNSKNVPTYVIEATHEEKLAANEVTKVINETIISEDDIKKSMDKIIRNVAKEVVI